MTDEQLNVALKVFDARMQEITDAYIERMAQHIKDIGQLTPSDVHVLTEYTRMNSNMRAMKRIIAIKSNKLVSDVEKIFQRAADDDEEWAAQYFKRAGKKASGTNKDYIKDIIQAQLNVTKNTLENLSQTTVTSSAYKQAVDKACQSVQTGVVDYRKAIRSTVKEASREGLRVRYESGLTRRLDTAARQNVLDSVRALNRDILKRVGEEFGADGVEISAHGLCAEDHLPYQGRQFSNEKFEKIQESLKRPIGQWNCKHTIYPIILGVSVQAIDNEELKHYTALSAQQITIDGKTKSRYQWSQEQRKVETEIRYLKDEANACKAMGDMQGRRETQAKIDALQEYYAHISAESGIGEEKWRMSVSGFSAVKEDPNLTFIENDVKIKASSGLPKVLKNQPDEQIKATVDVCQDSINGIVPIGAEAQSVTVIAGYGTSTPIKDLKRLYGVYPEYGTAESWQKKSARVESENYIYEVHWYEANGKVPSGEIKVKRIKK